MGRSRGEALFAAVSFSLISFGMAFIVMSNFEALRGSVIVLLSVVIAFVPGLLFIWLGHSVDLLEKKSSAKWRVSLISFLSLILLVPGILGSLAFTSLCKFFEFSNDYSGPDQAALKAVITIFILISIPAIWAIID